MSVTTITKNFNKSIVCHCETNFNNSLGVTDLSSRHIFTTVTATTTRTDNNSILTLQTNSTRNKQNRLEEEDPERSSAIANATMTTTTRTTITTKLAETKKMEDETMELNPPATIKFVIINNNENSSETNNKNNNSNCDKQQISTSFKNKSSNNIKSTTARKSTEKSDVKLDSSMFINTHNKLTTIKQQQRDEGKEQNLQQTEQIISTAKSEFNQINLKSSLYIEQQKLCNSSNNNNNNNMSNNQQNDAQQSKQHFNNNKKEKKKVLIKRTEIKNDKCETSKSNKNKKINNSNKMHDNGHNNSKKTHMCTKNSKNNNYENNEPEQQLISDTQTATTTTTIMTTIPTGMKTATKVRAEKIATTTTTAITIPTIDTAKAAKLTLRKSQSTPASFKIDNVAWESESNNNKITDNTNKKLLIASANTIKAEEEYLRDNKDAKGQGGGGGGDDVGGSGRKTGDNDLTSKHTEPGTSTPTIKTSAANTTKEKLANVLIETTTANSTITMNTTASTSPKIAAAINVAIQPQYGATQTIVQQQQQQQSNVKMSVKSTVMDKEEIADDEKNILVADTPITGDTIATSLSLPGVNFDADLRFGCAHYKRRAMFVTPCCNKFYKCRFCHDENESHHFDRKTLTELICSECNKRQKVQEQCEACGTLFGKYICLICNLFDDTDKKQYHCNGCGICRIGGAENFFHCAVCDMCLPIRLKIDGHRCVENISRSHCPVCLGDIHTSRIPCHIPDCGHLLHKTCFDQLLNSGHYTCPICQTSLIDMTALWEYLDAQAVSLPVPKKYENQQIHIFCNDCHKTTKTKFNFIGLKCMQCGAYNTTQDVKRRMSLVADEPSSA